MSSLKSADIANALKAGVFLLFFVFSAEIGGLFLFVVVCLLFVFRGDLGKNDGGVHGDGWTNPFAPGKKPWNDSFVDTNQRCRISSTHSGKGSGPFAQGRRNLVA